MLASGKEEYIWQGSKNVKKIFFIFADMCSQKDELCTPWG
jgi:hypothetical protein